MGIEGVGGNTGLPQNRGVTAQNKAESGTETKDPKASTVTEQANSEPELHGSESYRSVFDAKLQLGRERVSDKELQPINRRWFENVTPKGITKAVIQDKDNDSSHAFTDYRSCENILERVNDLKREADSLPKDRFQWESGEAKNVLGNQSCIEILAYSKGLIGLLNECTKVDQDKVDNGDDNCVQLQFSDDQLSKLGSFAVRLEGAIARYDDQAQAKDLPLEQEAFSTIREFLEDLKEITLDDSASHQAQLNMQNLIDQVQ